MLFPENAPNSSGCSSIQGLLASLDGASNIKTRKSWDSCIKLVRSHRKDIIALERVHRKFTRKLPGMEHFSYEERLDMLHLYSMGQRMLRRDSIWCTN